MPRRNTEERLFGYNRNFPLLSVFFKKNLWKKKCHVDVLIHLFQSFPLLTTATIIVPLVNTFITQTAEFCTAALQNAARECTSLPLG